MSRTEKFIEKEIDEWMLWVGGEKGSQVKEELMVWGLFSK